MYIYTLGNTVYSWRSIIPWYGTITLYEYVIMNDVDSFMWYIEITYVTMKQMLTKYG